MKAPSAATELELLTYEADGLREVLAAIASMQHALGRLEAGALAFEAAKDDRARDCRRVLDLQRVVLVRLGAIEIPRLINEEGAR